MNHALAALCIDEPDALVLGVAEVDLATLVENDVVRVHIVGNHGLGAVRRIRHNALAPVLADVKPSVGTEHQPVGSAAVLFEDGDLSARIDLMDAIVRNVREENVALAVDRRTLGELVSLADHLPPAIRIENGGDEVAFAAAVRFGDGLRVVAP